MTYALNSRIVTIEEFENVEVFGITIFNYAIFISIYIINLNIIFQGQFPNFF